MYFPRCYREQVRVITCDVTCSSLAGVYLAFLSVNTVRSQDVSSSLTLADDPCSLFSPLPIPTTVRGCCVPPVKSICLISKQHVAPIHTSHNHCPRCAQKLLQSAISCCGCWLRRPSPRPAPSTVSASPIIYHTHSHTNQRNLQPANVGNKVHTMGRGK